MAKTPDGFRRCSRCGEVRPVAEFPIKNRARGTRQSKCKACQRVYAREHYQRNRDVYLERAARQRHERLPGSRASVREPVAAYLRTHPCVDCGENDIAVLEFDHRDGADKRTDIAKMMSLGGLRSVLSEIAKCDVRCANCHRIRSATQFNWRKAPTFVDQRAPLPPPNRVPRSSSTGKPVLEQLCIWSVGTTRGCPDCGVDKPIHEFAFADRKTGRRQYRCRSCHAAKRREHYLQNRNDYVTWSMRQVRTKRDEQVRLVHDYLRAHPCVDCGETNIAMLEFDHVDRMTKSMEVSIMLGRRSWARILEEIGKCDVRCANCHRRKTARELGWYRAFGEEPIRYNSQSRGCVVVVANDLPKIGAPDRSRPPAQYPTS